MVHNNGIDFKGGVRYLREHITRVELLLGVALGLFYTWMVSSFKNPQLDSFYAGSAAFDRIFLYSQIATIVTTLLIAAFNDRMTRILRAKYAVIAVAVILSITTLGFLLVQGNAEGAATPLVLICGCLTGIASGFYALALMDIICFHGIDSIIIICVLGNVVSAFMRLIPPFMSSMVGILVIAALPLLSVLCVHAAVMAIFARDAQQAAEAAAKSKDGPSVPEPPARDDDGDKPLLLRVSLAMLIFGLI
ncbi:MAG: hypothetical protein IJJ14_07495, partial [Coriobacteriales bacterium]|nr:hypothetical protein [Coriobacteriales bacterium]